MSHEKVSVIMPCYNCAKTVEESIQSVLNQSCQDFKIIIVNDGSTDNTAQLLAQLVEQFPDKISLFCQPNQGQTKAKNVALKMCQGEYIALIDSDDLWEPDKLEKQLAIFEYKPEVGLCYTDGYYINEKSERTGIVGTEDQLQGHCLQNIMMGNAIVASSVMFRASLIEQVGCFDEELTACENWELWTRMSQIAKLYAVKDKLISYRQHQNNLSLNFSKLRENRIRVIQKNAQLYKDVVPDMKVKTKDALFKAYHFFGKNYLWHLKMPEARKDLITALKIKPCSLSCYRLLLKSFLGAWFFSKVRQLRGVHLARQIS